MLGNFDLFLVVGFAVPFALLAYVIYWALEIRHALFVRLYRNQALGVGLVALAVLFYEYGPVPFSFFPTAIASGVGFIGVYFGVLLIFYWLDVSLRAARRSDPLLRDSLNWSKARKILWPLIIGIVIILAVWNILDLGEVILFIVPPLIVIVSGAVYIPVVARRSRDPILRKHFIWFGVFFLGFFLASFGELGNFPFDFGGDLLVVGGLLLSGYFLYRSVRSLVPLNRISVDQR